MKKCHTAYIALGSNLEPRSETLVSAMILLDNRPSVWVRRVSQLIETEPVGGPPGQPAFMNGAAELETTLEPPALLAVLHEIERQLGRDRAREVPSGPRTCDLDLLLYEDRVLESAELTLPHPRLHERRFVLEPLAEIAGEVVHPMLKRTIRQLLTELESAPCPPA